MDLKEQTKEENPDMHFVQIITNGKMVAPELQDHGMYVVRAETSLDNIFGRVIFYE